MISRKSSRIAKKSEQRSESVEDGRKEESKGEKRSSESKPTKPPKKPKASSRIETTVLEPILVDPDSTYTSYFSFKITLKPHVYSCNCLHSSTEQCIDCSVSSVSSCLEINRIQNEQLR